MITIDELKNIELRVGTILSVEDVAGSDKLLKLSVDFGEEAPRQILSGIKAWYSAGDLENTQAIFVTNLMPRQMMGLESEGMILAVDGQDDTPVLLRPEKKVVSGSKVR